MKLENCGRCGLEPVKMAQVQQYTPNGSVNGMVDTWGCPADDVNEFTGKTAGIWNAEQFLLNRDRINAAAVAIFAGQFCGVAETLNQWPDEDYTVERATKAINAQDAAARVRWAEMQGE